jgi:preprotein translocase subunit SecB
VTEETTTPQQQIALQKIYVKDISFETPNSPDVFFQQTQTQPVVDIQVGIEVAQPNQQFYEVILGVTVTVTLNDKTAFLAEIKQAGLFTLSGFDDQQIHYVLNSYCPNTLFPFARETVSDLVTRGGFPQLLIEPINFDAMYQMQLQQQQEAGDQPPATVN